MVVTVRIRVTLKMLVIMEIFLEDPARHWYGLELIQHTGIGSGTLYPILYKLEKAGWLFRSVEDVNLSIVRRPARVNYLVTEAGEVAIRIYLAELTPIAAEN